MLKAALFSHPLVLLLFGAAGVLLGLAAPTWTGPAVLIVQISTALLNLLSAPLLIVATLSGLRHLLSLPHPARRLLMIVLAGAGLLLLCTLVGLLSAHWGQIGWQLETEIQSALGQLVFRNSHDADVVLFESNPDSALAAPARWALPDNVFFALTSGNLAAVMFCTLFFGLALTAQRRELSDSTIAVLEAISRTLEKMIGMVNVALPLLVLAFAAQLTHQWSPHLLSAMASFLIVFWSLVGLLCVGLIWMIYKMGTSPMKHVLQALKVPAMLSLLIPSAMAWVPSSIEGLSNRLGFSRGIVEMLIPASAVFLRTGAALQYAMLSVFVAHLYEHPISPAELVGLVPIVMAAALASAGTSGLVSLGFAAMVVAHLKLPFEAALPLFAAINLFCEGPTRLLSLLCSCVLAVFVCGGLPVEKQQNPSESTPSGPIKFTLNRRTAAAVASCLLLTSLLSTLLGLALGLRHESALHSSLPWHFLNSTYFPRTYS
jgi:aerobic C4-dicarboxylate transport protein